MLIRTILFALVVFRTTVLSGAEFDHSHTNLSAILRQHVEKARVNYRAIKSSPAALDRYLGGLAKVSRRDFDRWQEDQQVAYLINLYNARTIELIIGEYPIKSIKKIGWLPGAAWRKKFVPLFGSKVSLGHIEHEILRKKYDLPEIHFALVCAAKGCPPLLSRAYKAKDLRSQLVEQGRKFMADRSKNRVDAGGAQVYLSPIFEWFAEDFEEKSGSVIDFVRQFFSSAQAAVLKDDFKIVLTEYDWILNDQP